MVERAVRGSGLGGVMYVCNKREMGRLRNPPWPPLSAGVWQYYIIRALGRLFHNFLSSIRPACRLADRTNPASEPPSACHHQKTRCARGLVSLVLHPPSSIIHCTFLHQRPIVISFRCPASNLVPSRAAHLTGALAQPVIINPTWTSVL